MPDTGVLVHVDTMTTSNGGQFMQCLPIEIRREVYALLGLNVNPKDLRFRVVNETEHMPRVNDHYIFVDPAGKLAITEEEWKRVSHFALQSSTLGTVLTV